MRGEEPLRAKGFDTLLFYGPPTAGEPDGGQLDSCIMSGQRESFSFRGCKGKRSQRIMIEIDVKSNISLRLSEQAR